MRERSMLVHRASGGEDDEGGHRPLVDVGGMTTRRVGVESRVGDESRGVGEGEEGFGLQIASLGGAGLHESEVPLCW